MEDWSLLDNPDLSLSSLHGMVNTNCDDDKKNKDSGTCGSNIGFYWSASPSNGPGLQQQHHQQHQHQHQQQYQQVRQMVPFTSGSVSTTSITDINADIEMLFQQTFTLQQQEEQQRRYQQNAYAPVYHRSPQTHFDTQGPSSLGPDHFPPRSGPVSIHHPSLTSPDSAMHTPYQSSSSSRSRSQPSSTSTIPPFMTPDTTVNVSTISPTTIHSIHHLSHLDHQPIVPANLLQSTSLSTASHEMLASTSEQYTPSPTPAPPIIPPEAALRSSVFSLSLSPLSDNIPLSLSPTSLASCTGTPSPAQTHIKPAGQVSTPSPTASKPSIHPRPQLRLHIIKRRRPQSPRPCIKNDKDPMIPELDTAHARRLTIAILRSLGVILTPDELPIITLKHHSTDSRQVLPTTAMRLISSMILGTSGDKEVSQTIGSQICNGDLVALQQMVVAGLKLKNMAIHTDPSSPLPSSDTPTTNAPWKSHQPDDRMIFDLTSVTYHTPSNVTRLFLRLYRFILNVLLSTPDCWPFIQPVPASAVFYHQEIKYPMDLSTIEHNAWTGLYTRFANFEQDMQLVWENAKSFHRNAGVIPKHAENLEALFYKVVKDVKKQARRPQEPCTYPFDPSKALPEESDVSPVLSSVVYGISAISPMEPKAITPKGLTYDKQLYLQLNGPFFHAVERMKHDPLGNHRHYPRFYIAKNRTLLRQVRSNGVLAIFYNTKTTRVPSTKTYSVETSMVLTQPASALYDIDQTDDVAPKGWIHLRPLRVVENLVFDVSEAMERDYFRRMYATFKLVDDPKHGRPDTRRFLDRMIQLILGFPVIQPPLFPASMPAKSELSHSVWQKLLQVCASKGALVVNVHEKYSHLDWNSPDSEGFFKQVYFLEEVVVQVFRQMTMYQRITEVACLMKLQNIPHMAQLKAVLYNDDGDVAGLSVERYQTTLKQYTHAHTHHRLTAYQKYDIIYQMLDCMMAIHKAGLAHRDLSEVNIMLNILDDKLEDGTNKVCLYLIDFGKSVFCDPQDLRAWFLGVPRMPGEHDDDVVPGSEAELTEWCDALPWVKAKPDHGYRMYRSIQTLPKTRSDTQVLPWLIHPQSEDIYSIGVLIWKVFTETEPWRGILDTDLQGLRYVAEDDYRIQRALEHEVHGELSRQLLMKCLRTHPEDRASAADMLRWIGQDDVRTGLIHEWKMYSADTRATRKVKAMYGFDDGGDAGNEPPVADLDDNKRTVKKIRRGKAKSTRGT